MEQRIFAGITVAILLFSSVLLYLTDDNDNDIDDLLVGKVKTAMKLGVV